MQLSSSQTLISREATQSKNHLQLSEQLEGLDKSLTLRTVCKLQPPELGKTQGGKSPHGRNIMEGRKPKCLYITLWKNLIELELNF